MMVTERYRGVIFTLAPLEDLVPSLRFNPPYYEDKFREVDQKLRNVAASPIGRFIPDRHADGAKGIT
jgi:hypothetical protein